MHILSPTAPDTLHMPEGGGEAVIRLRAKRSQRKNKSYSADHGLRQDEIDTQSSNVVPHDPFSRTVRHRTKIVSKGEQNLGLKD